MKFLTEITVPTWVCLAASVVSLFLLKKLSLLDILATSVLWINLVVDLYATYLVSLKQHTIFLYNLSIPLLGMIVLYVYFRSSPIKWLSTAYLIALAIVMMIWLIYSLYSGIRGQFNYIPYIVTAFLIAAGSYLLMRNMVLRSSLLPPVILFFALANFAYYSLGMAAQYAEILKGYLTEHQSFVVKAYINDVGYVLSSVMILTGIIWKHRQSPTYSL
ncbi:MAG: hypothetical protein H6608_05215 [Flavobacteriales bacterium]|nr:hypothetical protein [Bacteroidota bacterium]MCB9240504.1 hypothetical protein [Flavobacteriales bacterium]